MSRPPKKDNITYYSRDGNGFKYNRPYDAYVATERFLEANGERLTRKEKRIRFFNFFKGEFHLVFKYFQRFHTPKSSYIFAWRMHRDAKVPVQRYEVSMRSARRRAYPELNAPDGKVHHRWKTTLNKREERLRIIKKEVLRREDERVIKYSWIDKSAKKRLAKKLGKKI